MNPREKRFVPRYFSIAWVMLGPIGVALALACTSDRPGFEPMERPRDAVMANASERDSIEDYVAVMSRCGDILAHSPYTQKLLDKIYRNFDPALEPPYDERANLLVSLIIDGRVASVQVLNTSDDRLEAPLEQAIEQASPFPQAPADVRDCVGLSRFLVGMLIFEKFRCEGQESYLAYRDEVTVALYKILYSTPYSSPPGRGMVRFSVHFGPNGEVSNLVIRSKSDQRAKGKLGNAIAELNDLSEPPDFERCFDDKPQHFHLEVLGSEG